MKLFYLVVLLHFTVTGYGQNTEDRVIRRMKEFHEYMVRDYFLVAAYLDDSLSYGHSNGLTENKKDFIANLGGRIIYYSFKEDSIRVTVNRGVAHLRFVADMDVKMDEVRRVLHLRVLEVWVQRGKTWKLFARQATR